MHAFTSSAILLLIPGSSFPLSTVSRVTARDDHRAAQSSFATDFAAAFDRAYNSLAGGGSSVALARQAVGATNFAHCPDIGGRIDFPAPSPRPAHQPFNASQAAMQSAAMEQSLAASRKRAVTFSWPAKKGQSSEQCKRQALKS